MIKKYISFAAASTVVLAPLALAAPTHAAVVAPAKTLYACQKKKTGALRIVKKSKKCKKSEKKISWNTKGPKGDKGDIGNPGLLDLGDALQCESGDRQHGAVHGRQ